MGNAPPYNINVLDCETYNDVNGDLYIYCLSYSFEDKVYSIYKDKKDDKEEVFIKFLDAIVKISKNNKTTYYIHNINFDGMLIMHIVFKNNLTFDWIVHNNNIYKIEIDYMCVKFIFKCSYKLLPISLKKLDLNGLNKKLFPYSFVNENNLNYIGNCPKIEYFNSSIKNEEYINFREQNLIFDLKKTTIDYCENDVLITLNFLNKINNILGIKYNKLFENSLSTPALSYKIFFKYWNNLKIKNKILKEEDLYIRKSYFGGRCEVFGNPYEDEITHYFDFSGMYEQCMRQKFPIGKGEFKNTNLNHNKIGFHCIKFLSNSSYPILPKHDLNKKLLFVNGEGVGCYWYEEIQLFEKFGGKILEITSSYEFENEGYPFENFINEFSSIKNKGGFYKTFAKLMINSLYGGFAMEDKSYESLVCFSELEAQKIIEQTDVLEYIKKNSCYLFKIIKNKKSNDIINKNEQKWSNVYSNRNVIYSSIIASKARIKLYNAINDVIESGGRPFYCDTDSIAAGYVDNRHKQKYNEVVWNEIWKDAVFIAPKFYEFIDEKNIEYIKLKGITDHQYSFDEIKKCFYSNKESIKFINQLNFKKKNFNLTQTFIDKIIFINSYNKRIFDKNKKKTYPIKH